MNCYYHPDRVSVAQCTVCGKNLCTECNIIKEGQSYCRECLGISEFHIETGRIILPALGCGVLAAILSVLPIISFGNILCCLWIILGGGLAVYILKRFHNIKGKITTGKAALTGGLTGFVAGIIMSVLLVAARGLLDTELTGMMASPEIQEMLGEAGMTAEQFTSLVVMLALVIYLVVFPLFGALGGIITNELTK
jgi:hypothetical protein